MDTNFRPSVFVSGGQTGGDSIPFSICDQVKIQTKGWMPKDYRRQGGGGEEIAKKYGLLEGEGGYAWRDKRNVEQSDALLGLLVNKEKTGKGTMQTANLFINGQYKHVQLDKPKNADFCIYRGKKPVLVIWDISPDKIDALVLVLRKFINEFKPKALMVAGSCEETVPGLEKLGAELLLKCFGEGN